MAGLQIGVPSVGNGAQREQEHAGAQDLVKQGAPNGEPLARICGEYVPSGVGRTEGRVVAAVERLDGFRVVDDQRQGSQEATQVLGADVDGH